MINEGDYLRKMPAALNAIRALAQEGLGITDIEKRYRIDRDGAIFSPDRKHRFALWRVWDLSKPWVMVIGLNPSTADETNPDPTITRIVAIAKHNGFGRLAMLNLFPLVSADPKALSTALILKYADNLEYLHYFKSVCDKVVFAWGNFKEAKSYAAPAVMKIFPEALCLVQNKDGSPKHPLYCKKDSVFQQFIAR